SLEAAFSGGLDGGGFCVVRVGSELGGSLGTGFSSTGAGGGVTGGSTVLAGGSGSAGGVDSELGFCGPSSPPGVCSLPFLNVRGTNATAWMWGKPWRSLFPQASISMGGVTSDQKAIANKPPTAAA